MTVDEAYGKWRMRPENIDSTYVNARSSFKAGAEWGRQEERSRYEGLLREIEWSGGDNTITPHCPSCQGYASAEDVEHPHYADKYGVGHRDWCDLAAALARSSNSATEEQTQ